MLLKTDYQDDILDLTQNANRKFNEVTNQDGSKSFEDVTEYEQEGTSFGAQDVNAITKALTDETHGVSFQFGIDGNGDYGYIKDGETEVTPFRNRHTETYKPTVRANNNDMGLYHKKRYVDTTAVPNANSTTYTFPQNDTGATKDLGVTNTHRYVNAQNVYNKGVADGRSGYMPIPTATKSITANGNNQDVRDYAKVNVNVPPYIAYYDEWHDTGEIGSGSQGMNMGFSVTNGALYVVARWVNYSSGGDAWQRASFSGGDIIQDLSVRDAGVASCRMWIVRATSTYFSYNCAVNDSAGARRMIAIRIG